MVKKSAFVTGVSSGLGLALAQTLVQQAWRIFGCSRRGSNLPDVEHACCDLTDHDQVPTILAKLLNEATKLDLVVLNAGILGAINDLTQTPLEDLKQVMEVNVWANKTVMDWLHRSGKSIGQVVMVSSGAAVLGNKGWNGYALSKAALNMLAKLYAHEFPATHISALAPGIIDTAMMDELCSHPRPDKFPALGRLRRARRTEGMQDPRTAAERMISVLPALRERPSGSFIDLREIVDPVGYAQLYGRSGADNPDRSRR